VKRSLEVPRLVISVLDVELEVEAILLKDDLSLGVLGFRILGFGALAFELETPPGSLFRVFSLLGFAILVLYLAFELESICASVSLYPRCKNQRRLAEIWEDFTKTGWHAPVPAIGFRLCVAPREGSVWMRGFPPCVRIFTLSPTL
jgi:hypothetical protein